MEFGLVGPNNLFFKKQLKALLFFSTLCSLFGEGKIITKNKNSKTQKHQIPFFFLVLKLTRKHTYNFENIFTYLQHFNVLK